MKTYLFGYSSHEEAPRVTLTYPGTLTEEQYKQHCVNAYAALFVEQPNLVNEHIQYIWDKALTYMLQFGFTVIEPVYSFFPFGWTSIGDANGWELDVNADNELLNGI